MKRESLTRRRLLQAAGVLPLVSAAANLARASEPAPEETLPKNAAEALKLLKDGNKRFAEGKVRHAHEAADWRKQLLGEQHPFAVILGCSDSRVPVELVFDQGFGDLFVIRVAGNVIADDVLGSIQYAVRHLKTALLVVLGHQGCGAVSATLDTLARKGEEPKYIDALVKRIEPGLKDLDPKLRGDARLNAAVEANARWSAKQIANQPEAKPLLEEKTLTLVGAIYELQTGKVQFLE